jgi:hypothetical protein
MSRIVIVILIVTNLYLNMLHAFLFSPIRATFPAHVSLLGFTILIQYKDRQTESQHSTQNLQSLRRKLRHNQAHIA